MKVFRQSFKDKKESKSGSQHISITPKSAIAIVPPKLVIKALYDYEPQSRDSQELGFHKGDFFHVISREDDTDWYEACNPLIPTARGLVPVTYFEVIGKTERQSGGSMQSLGQKPPENHDSGYSDKGPAGRNRSDSNTNTTRSAAAARSSAQLSGKGSGAMVYGVVQYDFNAERPDELEAKAGDAIIVVAQSNPEWFVAKPIGRLGGPGLIPVSFIEIKDSATGQPVTDPNEAVQRAGVPKVEDWKKMAADYKNSSISLGKFDVQQAGSDAGQSFTSGTGPPNGQPAQQSGNRSAPSQGAYGRQSQQQGQDLLAPVSASLPRYCFDNDTYWYIIECQMEDGRHWELSRYYADFYDFQIALLKEFPEEAGNRGYPRTLPFMPGPVAHVTDAISNGRRQNLDEYIRKILSMPLHIGRCALVRQLFAPRGGDFEIDPSAVDVTYRLSGASQHSANDPPGNEQPGNTVSQQSSNGAMNGNSYGGMGPPSSNSNRPPHQRNQHSISASSINQGGQSAQTSGFLQSMNRQPSSLTQNSSISTSNSAGPGVSAPTSAGPGAGAGAGSGGGAMKVKVMFQEELIVIRVPSDITFTQLKDKLQDRLKVAEELVVQYRDEASNSSVEMRGDTDLDVALQRNQKLTLFVGYAN